MIPDPPRQPSLQGLRVIVVEDEWLIATHLEDLLKDMGCQVVGHAAQCRQAVDLASEAEFDVALLDVNLAGTDVYPVAKAVAGRKIPFAFVTGYGVGHNMGIYRDRPDLQKPVTAAGLKEVLNSALSRDRTKH